MEHKAVCRCIDWSPVRGCCKRTQSPAQMKAALDGFWADEQLERDGIVPADELIETAPHEAPPAAATVARMTESLSSLVREQAAPVANALPAVWDLVLADMAARDAEGRRKYGVPLQPHNGRDVLVDAYQEALDLVVYLRQAIFERDGR